MEEAFFERLSAVDAAILLLETDSVLMHVGMLGFFEAAPVSTPDGRLDVVRLRTHVVGLLDSLPRLRQRIAYTPIERHPVWVDAEHFEPEHHVRFHRLEAPGSEERLRALVGELLGRRLDLARPLWEMHFIEGLEGGRFALVVKLHHCMVDGIAALEVFGTLFSPEAQPKVARGKAFRPRPIPTALALVQHEAKRRLASIEKLVRAARAPAGSSERSFAPRGLTARGVLEGLRTKTTLAEATPINPGRLGPRRSYAYVNVSLADLKTVKTALGGTVNDAVMAMVAGGLRQYFVEHGFAPGTKEINVIMPINARVVTGGAGHDGNRVVPTLVQLPLTLSTPIERFRAIAARTHGVKTSGELEGVAFLEDLANLVVVRMAVGVLRAVTRFWAGSFTVSNLPGPPVPFYLLGARLLAAYPVVPILGNQAIAIALISYAGSLGIGVLADPDAVPDVDRFVQCLALELEALVEAARKTN